MREPLTYKEMTILEEMLKVYHAYIADQQQVWSKVANYPNVFCHWNDKKVAAESLIKSLHGEVFDPLTEEVHDDILYAQQEVHGDDARDGIASLAIEVYGDVRDS